MRYDLDSGESFSKSFKRTGPVFQEQEQYGYEICVTSEDDFIVTNPNIKEKVLGGGLYV